jgi:hypothetical protein
MLISLYIIVGVVLMLAGVVLMAFVRLIPTKKDVASLPKAWRIWTLSTFRGTDAATTVLEHRRKKIVASSNIYTLFAMPAGIFLAQSFAVPAKSEVNGLIATKEIDNAAHAGTSVSAWN